MEVHINGRSREVPEGATITALLELFELQATTVVVEHNREILAKERFDEVVVKAGDQVEIVRFVGGGSR
jgi:thiamine biosynthesis protein ThiS